MKSAARFAGKDLEAMKAVARAQKERSLEMFKSTLQDYQDREFEAYLVMLNWFRTSQGSPHPLSPFGPVRHSPGAESPARD